jgi:gas vesicle protein
MNSGNTIKMVSAILAAAAAGAILGVLLAPDKGSNTRSRIINGAKCTADDVTERIKDGVNNLRNKTEETEA